MVRLAVLADIHGNGQALRAVLADLDGLGGADHVLVLGDVALLGPQPAEVVRLLLERGAIGVCGNHERFLFRFNWREAEPGNAEEVADRDLCLWTLGQLSPEEEQWLRDLPLQRQIAVAGQTLSLVHGSPRHVADTILPETTEETVRQMMGGLQTDVLLLGHSHQVLDRWVGGVRLINPGAVGFPQGEPGTARYAILQWDGEWRADFRTVPYDIEETISCLLTIQRPYRLWVVETLREAKHVPISTFD
ncbi:MAG: metallophosphoesterase family protein [Anaerolineales bacterium]|nr:metallophosphoesterase family protein [Anaerolineales bacterium]